MVYISLIEESQVVFVPRAAGIDTPEGLLTLRLRRGGAEVEFQGLQDMEISTQNYVFELEGAAFRLVTGEYDYTLEDINGNLASTGILTAGEYVREVKDAPGDRKIVEYGD